MKRGNKIQQGAFEFGAETIATGEQLRDAGITKAVDHAETLSPGWKEDAYKIILEFISRTDKEFMVEDIRQYAAEVRKFSAPYSSRAWGGPIRRAKNAGLIESMGLGPVSNSKAHCANATIWKVKINERNG